MTTKSRIAIQSKYQPVYSGQINIPGTPLMDGGNMVSIAEVYSPFFPDYYGEEVTILGVGNVGTYSDPRRRMLAPRWLLSINDMLALQVDSNGLLPGTGLVDERYNPTRPNDDDPDEALFVKSIRQHCWPAVRGQKIFTMLDNDLHLDPEKWNLNALSPFKIVRDLMHPKCWEVVQSSPMLLAKAQSGEPMTVGEYFWVMGGVIHPAPGTEFRATDKEDDNFIPHARQGYVRPIQSEVELLQWAASTAQHVNVNGTLRPMPHVFLDHNTRLGFVTPSDEFGLGGNNFYPIVRAAFQPFYLDGPYHKGLKVMVVGGTTAEYKVLNKITEAVDEDFNVVLAMYWTGTMNVGDLYELAETVTKKFAKKVYPTWDWLPAHTFGPEPKTFRAMSAQMKATAYVDAFGNNNTKLAGILRQLADEQAAMTKRGEVTPFQVNVIVHSLLEQNYKGDQLFWTMPQILRQLEEQK